MCCLFRVKQIPIVKIAVWCFSAGFGASAVLDFYDPNVKKFGGRGWIRTIEVGDNRFTVCPLWPLGNPPVLELMMGLEPATC